MFLIETSIVHIVDFDSVSSSFIEIEILCSNRVLLRSTYLKGSPFNSESEELRTCSTNRTDRKISL